MKHVIVGIALGFLLSSPAKAADVLVIGDSLTSSGVYRQEIEALGHTVSCEQEPHLYCMGGTMLTSVNIFWLTQAIWDHDVIILARMHNDINMHAGMEHDILNISSAALKVWIYRVEQIHKSANGRPIIVHMPPVPPNYPPEAQQAFHLWRWLAWDYLRKQELYNLHIVDGNVSGIEFQEDSVHHTPDGTRTYVYPVIEKLRELLP